MTRTDHTEAERLAKFLAEHLRARVRDIIDAGFHPETLRRMYQEGRIERVARGLYTIAGSQGSERQSLAEAAYMVPRGVICLLSALRYHELTTQAPFEVWIAIGPRDRVPRTGGVQLRVVRMSDATRAAGVENATIDGVEVAVFSVAKTIADCFKYRSTVGLDVALEALRDAVRARRTSVDEIWHYAKVDRAGRVIRPYLEALTA